ncbi:MAG: hypothetical protein ISS33_07525 [Candidatus Omnitrophica bacterium]|nr:hypothetical protein [Candidatus Omnitrophota bacterium]
MKNLKKSIRSNFVKHVVVLACLLVLLSGFVEVESAKAELIMENGAMGLSMPLWADLDEDSYELCPQGVNVVGMFLALWKARRYDDMYKLLDEESIKGYSPAAANFDFQFMEYKQYSISAIRKKGGNFEFFLSFGDWKNGDKELRKMMISGKSYKIIMLRRGEFLERSADSYF